MSSRKSRVYDVARRLLFRLRPQLDGAANDVKVAEEWVETFSLDLVRIVFDLRSDLY